MKAITAKNISGEKKKRNRTFNSKRIDFSSITPIAKKRFGSCRNEAEEISSKQVKQDVACVEAKEYGKGFSTQEGAKQDYRFKLTAGIVESLCETQRVENINEYLDSILKSCLAGEIVPIVIYNYFAKKESLNDKVNLINIKLDYLFKALDLLDESGKKFIDQNVSLRKRGTVKKTIELRNEALKKMTEEHSKEFIENFKKVKVKGEKK